MIVGKAAHIIIGKAAQLPSSAILHNARLVPDTLLPDLLGASHLLSA